MHRWRKFKNVQQEMARSGLRGGEYDDEEWSDGESEEEDSVEETDGDEDAEDEDGGTAVDYDLEFDVDRTARPEVDFERGEYEMTKEAVEQLMRTIRNRVKRADEDGEQDFEERQWHAVARAIVGAAHEMVFQVRVVCCIPLATCVDSILGRVAMLVKMDDGLWHVGTGLRIGEDNDGKPGLVVVYEDDDDEVFDLVHTALDMSVYSRRWFLVGKEKPAAGAKADAIADSRSRQELESDPSSLPRALKSCAHAGVHNDQCEFCDLGGTLWQCFHCNLVAHPACLDSQGGTRYINVDNEIEWCCSSCIKECKY
jgi:hypothetical protein